MLLTLHDSFPFSCARGCKSKRHRKVFGGEKKTGRKLFGGRAGMEETRKFGVVPASGSVGCKLRELQGDGGSRVSGQRQEGQPGTSSLLLG
ncbi:unnamed protein product [Boreogadus saida]